MYIDKHNGHHFPKVSTRAGTIHEFALSQLLLFNSRRKNALVYAMATVVGIFCAPGGFAHFVSNMDPLFVAQRAIPLPLMTLLMAVGLYVFNDLSDVHVDRVNGKKRPIPMGLVTKTQTIFFVISTNVLAAALAASTANLATIVLMAPMITLGLLYSAPKITLKDRFVVKTLTIAVLMAFCVLLGTTVSAGSTSSSWARPAFGGLMVGMMVFVTSPLNDLGDIKGDAASGRRTIPLVLGKKRTIGMISLVASSMSAVSWIFYLVFGIGILGPLAVTAVTWVVLLCLRQIRNEMCVKLLRKQHARLVPMHFILQIGIALGAIFIA